MARRALVRDGIAGVKIERIAHSLGVTRGGFYSRFSGLIDLLDALLRDWLETNARIVTEALRTPGEPIERFKRLMHVWIDGVGFDPDYDLAIRDWARTSRKVDRAVRKADDEFVEALAAVFRDAGRTADEALIRARVVHYHQVGYHGLRVKRKRSERYATADLYLSILTGFEGSLFETSASATSATAQG